MIKSEIKNNTAIISLARPDKRNALHPELVEQLKSAFNDAENNEEVKSVIITGEGSSFCAGADLSYLKELNDNSLLEIEKDS
ncbi:MAG: enoyl-CoA hydratase/isomerase family protein, partial [Ignavibacteriaceae bacterium]|nr:enoyl-CoA hydratase/isomerase family protein [Ignavibacteriaceae bacterium]